MTVTFVVMPFFPDVMDELTVEWEDDFLPALGDEIDVLYYLEDEACEKIGRTIIVDDPENTSLENKYIGKTMEEVLNRLTITKVVSRFWQGKEVGLLLTCEAYPMDGKIK